jgi:DNA-binding transcriptional LysR family regulator
MQMFAAVVRHRSMSAAARALRLTPSAVSQQIKELEQRSGVTLLLRTTRSLTLTDAGERFHSACVAMVSASELARAELNSARTEPIGELRISAPVGFARHLHLALRDLLRAHPSLKLSQLLSDEREDLIAMRVDLGIAFGNLPDSGWSAQKLGSFQFWLFASPDYLQHRAIPTLPEELAAHDWIRLGKDKAPTEITLVGPGGRTITVPMRPRVVSNEQQANESACLAGLGIGLLSSLDVASLVPRGQLVRLLPDWSVRALDIWALTPQRQAQPAKVRLAIEAIKTYLDETTSANSATVRTA